MNTTAFFTEYKHVSSILTKIFTDDFQLWQLAEVIHASLL